RPGPAGKVVDQRLPTAANVPGRRPPEPGHPAETIPDELRRQPPGVGVVRHHADETTDVAHRLNPEPLARPTGEVDIGRRPQPAVRRGAEQACRWQHAQPAVPPEAKTPGLPRPNPRR